MEKIDNNSSNEVAGGKVTINREPNGNIKEANYYCDKCGALVSVQRDGKFNEKIKHSMEYDGRQTKILCEKCMD